MKNLILSIIICLFINSLYAQSVPQGMKYQAVARDLKGELIANQQVSLKIQLQSNDQLSEIYYSENHVTTTNQFGLFSLVIGEGIIEQGDFSEIPWNTKDIWIKIAIKLNGEASYTTISNSKLLTVPYAFHAGTANALTTKKSSDLFSKDEVGVSSQNWSLFGNSKSDPLKDKLGTSDAADLVFVTDNKERLRITADGQILTGPGKFTIGGNLEVQGDQTRINKDLYVGRNVVLNFDNGFDPKGETINIGNFTVANQSLTKLTGKLEVDGDMLLNSNLVVRSEGKTMGEHVALFENTKGGDGDGIAIKINKEETTDKNNFITFYRKEKVAGRIEGFSHKIGDTLVIVNWFKTNYGTASDFMIKALGFTPPFSFNENFIKLKIGSYPTLTPGDWPGVSGSTLVSLHLSGGTWPTLTPGTYPSLKFESLFTFKSGGSLTDIIQPWTWFNPNYSDLLNPGTNMETLEANPIFHLIKEAQENDWKGMLGLGIGDLAVKAVTMELEALAKSGGITYGSKGADYAEWLPRNDVDETLFLGQVVGVKGGKISLNTKDADQVLVISSKPIVLGNMPNDGEENEYEKVAFLGQVPTWVKGAVLVGDYILTSDKNDGIAIALSPAAIKATDLHRIVGKAWSSSKNNNLNLINVAIGLNRNDMADIVVKQQEDIINLNLRMETIEKKLKIESTISQ